MPLSGRKILVVEDEYLVADDLASLLREAGALVIGPAASLPQAMRLASDTELIDAAVLDINLGGIEVYPLADELRSRAIPILFLTGYGENHIPDEYASITRCEKPVGTTYVVEELRALITEATAAA